MSKTFDTAHVRNVGEFFSQHYLDAVLESDLKGVLKGWREAAKAGGGRNPPRALASLAEPYFRTLARLGDREAPIDEATTMVRELHASLLEALGYAREPVVRELPDGTQVPLTLELTASGKPFLWIGEAGFGASFGLGEDDASLDLPPLGRLDEDTAAEPEGDGVSEPLSWRLLFDGPLLRQEHAPRWVLLLSGGDVYLIDRDRWPQGRYLHFELGAMLGHRKPAALRAFAGLLHREVLAPESVAHGGQSLLDEIDEKSHKHAFGVSTDLKFGVQQAIEILGNEVVFHLRHVARKGVFDKPELAAELSRECITFMYRLLFLFYVEARGGEVGAVPTNSDAYRKGLSLESLRDLELVPLLTDKARNGTFIHQSLEKLFEVIHLGWPTTSQERTDKRFDNAVDLRVKPQRSPLFNRKRTPLVSSVKLRNAALQKILQLLSLSKEGRRGAGGRQRGRISYAQLGINQLGAVYEGLLSYTGFFANEELFEVKRASDKDKDGVYEHTYYVPASKIEPYTEDELIRDRAGKPVRHAKGTFLFRLAGRDREKSASYYTPEVLTECLTKYTLKERLGKAGTEGALSADEILELTICEPAMGSGAFLNEAVSQLAHAYLERKQAELGKTIAAEQYQREWTRVKYHFVAHRVYGVDLNPLATELGKISLWLGVLDADLQAPFMDTRLVTGNSLIGARREVYGAEQLTRKATKSEPNWWGTPGQRLAFGEKRPAGSVYHFLVPNDGMAPYDKDKVVKGLCPDEVKAVKAWHKAMAKPFTKEEVAKLQEFSDAVDALWERHTADRREAAEALRQPVGVWGHGPPPKEVRQKTVEECENIAAGRLRADGPGAKLKAVMDLWCGRWMWPVLRADELPSRERWFEEIERRLVGGVTEEERAEDDGRFVHWELQFAEVFSERGGFDVLLGNPPWIKLQWTEAGVLADLEPLLDVRKHSAKKVADLRNSVLTLDGADMYFVVFSQEAGAQSFLNAPHNYRLLQGVQTNLYKCFLTQSVRLGAPRGSQGFLHQAGVFDDPKGGVLRGGLSRRLRTTARFKNELILFPEVDHQRSYALSVLGGERPGARYASISNLFHPRTLDGCFDHDGIGPVPGIKDEDGNWDLRPHRDRLVHVDTEALALFAELYDPPGTPAAEARLPVVHSQAILNVLRRFAQAPKKLSDLEGEYFCTVCFDETGRVKDGTIRRETRFPKNATEWVVSGPHFYVGTPFNKTPNEGCRHNQDYTVLDLTQIPDDYLPRTNYVPACTPAEYLERTPKWNGKPVTDFYRHVHRKMLAPTGERTFVSALLPPGPATLLTAIATVAKDERFVVALASLSGSIPFDFFLKSTGRADWTVGPMGLLPMPEVSDSGIQRTLQLNCLTTHYADLYNRNLPTTLTPSANPDPRCAGWDDLPKTWTRDAALRTPFARRQALIELDALAALSLGLTLDELLLIYRVQFPVLQQYERETYYDQRGKIVFTTNRGLSGVGLTRKEFEPITHAQPTDPLPDYAHDQQGPFEPPFTLPNREEDTAQAYEYFKRLLGDETKQ